MEWIPRGCPLIENKWNHCPVRTLCHFSNGISDEAAAANNTAQPQEKWRTVSHAVSWIEEFRSPPVRAALRVKSSAGNIEKYYLLIPSISFDILRCPMIWSIVLPFSVRFTSSPLHSLYCSNWNATGYIQEMKNRAILSWRDNVDHHPFRGYHEWFRLKKKKHSRKTSL